MTDEPTDAEFYFRAAQAVLAHDERGQGVLYAEAMTALKRAVDAMSCTGCGGRAEVRWFDGSSGAPGCVTETCPECNGSGRAP